MTSHTPPAAAPSDANATLPHERDQQAGAGDASHADNRKTMDRARRDAESKIVDTERIGTPNDLPSAGDDATPER